MPDLPPPGPARDALVATALGCTTWGHAHCWCDPNSNRVVRVIGSGNPRFPHDVAHECSTTDAGAIAALEAWRRGDDKRFFEIGSPLLGCAIWGVTLYQIKQVNGDSWNASAPTLGDAASRALIEAAEAGKEGT